MAYYQRLRAKAWEETRTVWTSYRWWLSASPPVAAILLLLTRRGWREIMNAQDVIVNGIGGAAIAFLGTVVIGLMRSPKLLDDNRVAEISGMATALATQQQRNTRLEATLARSPADEAKLAHVHKLLENFSEDERCFLRWLLHNGETPREKLTASPAPEPSVWSTYDKGCKNELLRTRIERTPASEKHFLSVNPNYIEPLKAILFDLPVTPPSV